MAVSFHTLAVDLGLGCQCKARFGLRTDPADFQEQVFMGVGFGVEAWSARQAAEGEALERATWHYGALWNSVWFPDELGFLPEETRLMLKPAHITRLTAQPSASVPAFQGDAATPVWIPAEAVFFQPSLAQGLKRHSVTTGWAFHRTQAAAAATGYLEVIERDLQMLFWFGRLAPHLKSPPKDCLNRWLARMGWIFDRHSPLRILQTPVNVSQRFGAAGWFTVVLHPSDEPPYLSVGSALKTDREVSLRAALGEYAMLRTHQAELILAGIKQADPIRFTAHIIAASQTTELRDRALQLVSEIQLGRAGSYPHLDYQALPYAVAFLQPPPIFHHGVVAKVWVGGCQPMIPAGFTCGLTDRWQNEFSISLPEWEAQRWHPYP